MRNIYVICGLPGTGKTHYARQLETDTGAVRISRDEVRHCLIGQPDFSTEEKAALLEIMLRLAEEWLRRGRDVILEGMPFSRKTERDQVRRLAVRAGAECACFLCVCPEATALRRLAGDSAKELAADRDGKLYRRVRERFEPLGPDEPHTVISTD